MQTNRGAPTPPIAFAGDAAGVRDHRRWGRAEVSDELREQLAATGADVSRAAEIGEASRDWWPLAMIWALDDQVTARAAVVVRPHSADEVAAVLRLCNDARVPVTAAAGRSGVCGASVPVFGGVLLDLTAIAGIVDVDQTSMLVDVLPGTFGDVFEDELRDRHGVTCGHWPQSMALSTVGGWLACRGAGQLSTRYGKIEDIVVGLDVVLADGTLVTTGGAPRAAVGPDLTQLFVGSEGTLGIIVGARLRLHPLPAGRDPRRLRVHLVHRRARRDAPDRATRCDSGGAAPVRRDRRRPQLPDRRRHVLLALDEGDAHVVEATRRIVDEECATADRSTSGSSSGGWSTATTCPRSRRSSAAASSSTRWRSRRRGARCPTCTNRRPRRSSRSSTRWSRPRTRATRTPTACLYFTFAGKPPADDREAYYRAAWDAGQRAVLAAGGALSHHHGVGLNRSRFVADALGAGSACCRA